MQPIGAAETASTWDWAVKLEFQAGINLAGYVHINMLIICSMMGHVVCGKTVTFKRTQCKGTCVCIGKYVRATEQWVYAQKLSIFSPPHTHRAHMTQSPLIHPRSFSLFSVNSLNRRCRTALLIMCSFWQKASQTNPRKQTVTCLRRKLIPCHAHLV